MRHRYNTNHRKPHMHTVAEGTDWSSCGVLTNADVPEDSELQWCSHCKRRADSNGTSLASETAQQWNKNAIM